VVKPKQLITVYTQVLDQLKLITRRILIVNVYAASSSRAASQLLETAIDASQIHQLANSRGASLQILCHPWAQSFASSTASSSSSNSSGLGDRIGRISLSNLSREYRPVLFFSFSYIKNLKTKQGEDEVRRKKNNLSHYRVLGLKLLPSF
jgi:hypothetical protein